MVPTKNGVDFRFSNFTQNSFSHVSLSSTRCWIWRDWHTMIATINNPFINPFSLTFDKPYKRNSGHSTTNSGTIRCFFKLHSTFYLQLIIFSSNSILNLRPLFLLSIINGSFQFRFLQLLLHLSTWWRVLVLASILNFITRFLAKMLAVVLVGD